MAKRVVVVGGGISGLTTAYWLKKLGYQVALIEKAARAGGTIRSHREHGFIADLGANSTLETTPLIQKLLSQLNIEGERVYANDAAKNRYIVRGGTLHPLPMSPGAFFKTHLFSWPAKLRLLSEPLISRGGGDDESVSSFVDRRFGREFLEYAVNPFVSGVYAGDPARLSVRSAFPKLYELERDYGSVLLGAIKGRKQRKKRVESGEVSKNQARMLSFTRGMAVVTEALAAALEGDTKLQCEVCELRREEGAGTHGWSAVVRGNGGTKTVHGDALVLATPADTTAELVRDLKPEISEDLKTIVYPPVSVVFLGYKREQVRREIDGFGFLVPAVEGRRILGAIFSSAIFPNRAPEGCVALTAFVGGTRQPELTSLSEGELLDLVKSELDEFLGLSGDTVYGQVRTWRRAIPQYGLGHPEITRRLGEFELGQPGLFLCANFRGGIAVGDCIKNADMTVRAVETSIGAPQEYSA
jgi:oxygen-dependent protoporphyrinogen oxidase